jgi:hypothetical protein
VEFTQEDYLRHYARNGELLGGACELRQRWYKSSAKPRTYIAQGGQAYRVSMCTQDFWTELVNSIPVTNHITRLLPDRLRLRPGSRLRIYDLESFTSRFHEQKFFLDALSTFCRGVPFTYVDVKQGLITIDMGDLISDYNHECNYRTPISFERVPSLRDHPVAAHHYASALGIYGNLMTCTLPHGIIMMQLVEHEDQVNVAGDDGAVDENDDNEDQIDIAITAMGKYSREKCFDSSQPGVICLKRPLQVAGSTVIHGVLIIPPCLISIAELRFDYEDPRYRYVGLRPIGKDLVRRTGRELFRFLRSAYRARYALTIDEMKIVLSVIHRISILFEERMEGHLMICGGDYSWPGIPNHETWSDDLIKHYFSVDPLLYTASQCYTGYARVASRGWCPYTPSWESSRVGEEFRCNSSRLLGLWETLGYIEKEDEFTLVSGEIGFQIVCQSLVSTVPKVSSYRVLKDVPSHLVF